MFTFFTHLSSFAYIFLKRFQGTLVGLIAVSVVLSITSCGTKNDPFQALNCSVSTASYTQNIKPIMMAQCSECHSATSPVQHPDGTNFDTYVDASTKAKQIFLRSSAQTMPSTFAVNNFDVRHLNNDELCLIQAWLDGGTPE